MADGVAADHGAIRYLVKDAGAVIALDDIVLVEHVATIDVAPQAGTDIVVDLVAPKDNAVAERQLHAAGLPAGREAAAVVGPDPIVLDQNVTAGTCQPDLAV